MESIHQTVQLRRLRSEERAIETNELDVPLVIEPSNFSELDFLQGFLARHSSQIISDIETYGAVLLRGFSVKTDVDFERIITSIDGLHPIRNVFMSEPGRDIVSGTHYVFYSNKHYKTGGGLDLGGIHTENYYVPDVPRFICFFCRAPSWYGGETGLVNIASVLSDLPQPIQTKLETTTFYTNSWTLAEVAARYHISVEDAEQRCTSVGLPIVIKNGQTCIEMYKPSILEHPITKEKGLCLNFSGQLAGLDTLLRHIFARDYRKARWIIHRLTWRFPWLGYLRYLHWIVIKPKEVWKFFFDKPEEGSTVKPRVGSAFTRAEIECIARSIRARCSSFTWKRGDVLLVDNMKMAHCGMPGLGPRLIRASMCKAIRLDLSADAKGYQKAAPTDTPLATLGDAFVQSRGA